MYGKKLQSLTNLFLFCEYEHPSIIRAMKSHKWDRKILIKKSESVTYAQHEKKKTSHNIWLRLTRQSFVCVTTATKREVWIRNPHFHLMSETTLTITVQWRHNKSVNHSPSDKTGQEIVTRLTCKRWWQYGSPGRNNLVRVFLLPTFILGSVH